MRSAVYRLLNWPRGKYPRQVAVDYELVYSINTASWVTGNLMKVQDTHTHTLKKTLHIEGAPEGTQRTPRWQAGSRCHVTLLASLCWHMRLKLKRKQQKPDNWTVGGLLGLQHGHNLCQRDPERWAVLRRFLVCAKTPFLPSASPRSTMNL